MGFGNRGWTTISALQQPEEKCQIRHLAGRQSSISNTDLMNGGLRRLGHGLSRTNRLVALYIR